MKMVEDPLKNAANKASEVIQDLSGVVQDISGVIVQVKEVVQDISGVIVKIEVEETVRERSSTVFNVVEKVIENIANDAKKEADKIKAE
jgi:hypothetical protein